MGLVTVLHGYFHSYMIIHVYGVKHSGTDYQMLECLIPYTRRRAWSPAPSTRSPLGGLIILPAREGFAQYKQLP